MIDMYFLIDIFLNFRTPFFDNAGRLVYSTRCLSSSAPHCGCVCRCFSMCWLDIYPLHLLGILCAPVPHLAFMKQEQQLMQRNTSSFPASP